MSSTVRSLIEALQHVADTGGADYEVRLRVSRGDGVPLRAPVQALIPEVVGEDTDGEIRIITLWGNTAGLDEERRS